MSEFTGFECWEWWVWLENERVVSGGDMEVVRVVVEEESFWFYGGSGRR